MIKQEAFSVYDDKAGTFSPPFYFATKGQAIRMFGDLVNDKQTQINKHPSDYRLFWIGSFDQVSGELTAVTPPSFLCAAVDFLNKVVPNGS